MRYIAFSFSHKTVDINSRDKLAFSDEKNKKNFLAILLAYEHIKEAILLSTCNRTEFIIYGLDVESITKFLLHELSFYCNIKSKELENIVMVFRDKVAIEHIFKVASSLESIVVGETQITGQLKDAYRFSMANEFCSKNLSRVIHCAFKCAANIRNKTDISKDNTSVTSVAIKELKKRVSVEGKKVLIVGTGEVSRLAIKYLIKEYCHITLINRTLDNAQTLADEFDKNIDVVRFDNLALLINKCDILFTATSSNMPIITKDMIEKVDFPRYWFDMALPQDIGQYEDDDIVSYNIDSLKQIVKNAKSNREEGVSMGYSIVKDFVNEFLNLQQQAEASATIKSLKQRAKKIYLDEISYATKKGYLSGENHKQVEKMIDRAFSKFLHSPLVGLKKLANKHTASNIGNTVNYLFGDNVDINFTDRDLIESYK